MDPVAEGSPELAAPAVEGALVPLVDQIGTEPPKRPGFWRRLMRQRLPFLAFLFVCFAIVVAILAPWISPYDPSAQDLSKAFQGPNAQHWLGTDQVGRDSLSRVIAGTRLSILAMLQAITIAVCIGVPLGMSAGYFGRWWERFVARLNDVFFSLPAILVVFGIVAVAGVSLTNAMTGLGIVFSTRYVALGRSMVKSARGEAYVDAAKVLGVGGFKIVTRHITPNIMRPIVVQTSVLLGAIILIEAELSYLGLGADASSASWGRMLHDSQNFFARQPFLPFPAGIAITLLVVAINLAGDGVADAMSKQQYGGALAKKPRKIPIVAAGVQGVELAEESKAPSTAVLEVDRVSVSYPDGSGGSIQVVDGVSLYVSPGETLGIAGESGCGKSMTISAIMGLVPQPGRISSGSVRLAGRDLTDLSEKEWRDVRGREIGMVFQEPSAALDPAMTIGRQLAEPLRIHEGMTRKQAAVRAAELLALVGVTNPHQRLNDYPHQFSGGMAQRVVIARALACNPKILLADEPTTALDVTVQAQVLDLLSDLQDQLGMGIVLVTHDLGVVADVCDRVAVMYAGQIVESGRCEDVFANPRHPYTAALMASTPSNTSRTGGLATIPGRVPPPWEWSTACRFHDRCSFAVDTCKTVAVELDSAAHTVRCLRADEITLGGTS